MRTLTLRRTLGGESRWLGRIFCDCWPHTVRRRTDTINQASVFPPAPLGNSNNFASLRMVVDVGAWENSRWSLPGGQSGNPLSPHYDDLFRLWQRGEGVPIAWSPEEVKKSTRNTLRLQPAVT